MLKTIATIKYEEINGTPIGEDPITCEPIYETTGKILTLLVSIEPVPQKARTIPKEGTDRTGLYCAGRAMLDDCHPRFDLPYWYQSNTVYDIEWDDGKIGSFYSLPTVLGRLGHESCYGYPITGILLDNEQR